MVPERAYRVNFFPTLCAGLVLLGISGTSACRTGLQGGTFVKSGVRYRVGPVPPGFHPVSFADNDLAFESAPPGQAIAVNATCQGHGDASLEVLTRHLFTGFSDIELLGQTRTPLDARDALKTHVRAKLDGVACELMLVVMKKNGCVFDLSLLSPPSEFAAALPTFEELLHQFQVEAP